VLLRGDESPRLEASELLRLAAAAALTVLAIEDAREETEQSLRGSLFDELRSREDLSGPEIVRRALRLGCDLSAGAVMVCAELDSDRPRLVIAAITADYPGALAQELDGAGTGARPRVYAALPAVGSGNVAQATIAAAQRLVARLQRYGAAGVSSFHSDAAKLGDAVREAELALDVLHEAELALDVLQHSGAVITDLIGDGTYKLLFRVLASHPDEVREFYETTIAALVSYDAVNRTELTHTLGAYLECNCNMNATAAAIFAHRHTVAYRLERIHVLTGLDPLRCEDRERLGLGLKVHRVLAPQLARQAR
jgi:DNA-binding PucR family transcriptional regulator